MSQIRPCPKCGGEEVLRAHRKTGWERLASVFGFYPYTCRGCRSHFLRHRRGTGMLLLLAAVWLCSAALVGGAAAWFLGEAPPNEAGAGVKAPAAASRPLAADARELQLRASLHELRLAVARLSAERDALKKQLTQQHQAPAPAAPDPRLAQLEARNRQLSQELEAQRSSLAALAASKAAPPKPPAASAKPADASRGLLATISFGPGLTQLGPRDRAMLQQAADGLGQAPGGEILVQGMADSVPLGKATAKLYYDNAGLALARSLSVFRALRDLGVDPERMQVSASGAPAKEPGAGRTVKVWLLKRPG